MSAALPTLRAPRLTLRPLATSDAGALVEGVGNFDVSKWLAVVPYPYGRSDADDFLRRVRDEGRPVWAIEDATGLVGCIGVDGELGYWLARPAWGKGYGFEAAHAVVANWFRNDAHDVLATGYFDGNERSGAILRALGFRDSHRYQREARALSQTVWATGMTLTRDDWERRQDFTLYTPRLTLRAGTCADAPAFAALARPEVARNLENIPADMSLADARAELTRRMWRGTPGFTLLIEQGGDVIGWIGFGGAPLSLGYALLPEHWGHGLMTEALSAFLPELFERFPISRIAAEHFTDNPASGAVLRKMGFEKTGEAMLASKARLEPAPVITYAVTRDSLKVPA